MAYQREKYLQLVNRVEEACRRSKRDPKTVKILAATKYASVQDIIASLEGGLSSIGENKIQDAEKKFSELTKGTFTIEKHFIGHLQKNKARKAVQLFDLIESVDSIKLLQQLNLLGIEYQKIVRVLLEVNIAHDQNKHGFTEKELWEILQNPQSLKNRPLFSNISIEGLMTIVPFSENQEDARPYFKKMRILFEEVKKHTTENKLFKKFNILSMGMSPDFEVAIEEGATEIRIGSYLFET